MRRILHSSVVITHGVGYYRLGFLRFFCAIVVRAVFASKRELLVTYDFTLPSSLVMREPLTL